MIHSHYRTFQPEEAGHQRQPARPGPLHPFGHGLSYASFGYANLRLSSDRVALGDTVQVSVDVTNTSTVDADEVVELYLHQRYGPRAVRSGVEGVRPGRDRRRGTLTRTVGFDLGPDQLRYWSAVTRGWVQDATEIEIYVGGDSTATLGTLLTVTSEDRHARDGDPGQPSSSRRTPRSQPDQPPDHRDPH